MKIDQFFMTILLPLLVAFSAHAQGDVEIPRESQPKPKITCDLKQTGASFFLRHEFNEDFLPLNEFQGHEYDFCFLLMQDTLVFETLNPPPFNLKERVVGETGTITFSDGTTKSKCDYKILKSLPHDHPLNIISLEDWIKKNAPDGDIMFDLLFQNKDALNEAVEITCDNMFLS